MAFNIRSMVIRTSGRIQPRPVTATDPYFSSVTLLLQAETTNTGTIIDSSTNNYSVTVNGTPAQGAVSPFANSGGSEYFNGTTDYLNLPDNNAASQFTTDNFTVEFWIYSISAGLGRVINSWNTSTTQNASWEILVSGATIYFSADLSGTAPADVLVSTALSMNTWNHVAAVRNGSSFTLYVNGVGTSATYAGNLQSANTFTIGARRSGASYVELWNGYLSNVRLVKGTAVYTGNFTPSTSPLTAITNTSLLLNFNNAKFLDGSRKMNLKASTGGDISTSIKKYGTGAIVGKLDILDYGSNFVFTGDFTVECWAYNPVTTDMTLWGVSGATFTGLNSNTVYTIYLNDTTLNSSAAVVTNTWQHVAVARVGTTVTIYVNGTASGTVTKSGTIGLSSATSTGQVGGAAATKYVDDLRITKGVARYTGNFTPPTEAFLTQ